MENKENESKFPSVGLAYEIAMDSYRITRERFDTINNSIDRTLTWMSSFNLGLIALVAGKQSDISFQSWWFYSAMILFATSLIVGIFAKIKRVQTLRSPDLLFRKWLKKSEWMFKKDSIWFAGQNYIKNKKIIDTNGVISDCIIFLFMSEIIMLALWLIL